MTSTRTSKSQRQRKLGIECPDRLVWKSWEPGEEHERKIIIKNTESRTQVISFTLPEHRTTFLTPFPEPVTLSGGMCYEINVRFCPTELVEVHDSIEVLVKGRGSCTVRLDCLTPFARLRCTPASRDFGFCAVHSTTTRAGDEAVQITNSGTVPIDYYWEVPAPFAISPVSGHLETGQSQLLRLSFSPTEACAVVAQAVCKMAEIDEVLGCVQLSGVGKYPFVRLQARRDPLLPPAAAHESATKRRKTNPSPASAPAASVEQPNAVTTLIDFHEVPAGRVATHEVVLENPSAVPAQVRLYSHGTATADTAAPPSDEAVDVDGVCFRVRPAAATIPAGGHQTFTVTFAPRSTGSQNAAAYELRAMSGNVVRLGVRGSVVGPRVKLSASHLDYGSIDLDRVLPSDHRPPAAAAKDAQQLLVRHVTLTNMSTAGPCHFQVLATSPGAAFRVEPTAGAVPPGRSLRLRVTFQPTAPIAYMRRLLLLIEDGQEMLYVDAFGVAYDAQARPPPLGLPEVEAFHARLAAGEEREAAPPLTEALSLYDGRTRRRQGTGHLSFAAAPMAAQLALVAPPQQPGRGPSSAWPYRMDARLLTFALPTSDGSSAAAASGQLVTVANLSDEPAVATWACPAGSPFAVTPVQQDVPARGSAVFQVVVRTPPTAADGTSLAHALLHYSQHLECYVNGRRMSSFRYVTDACHVTPPYCLTLHCRVDAAAATAPSARTAALAASRGSGKQAHRPAAATAAELEVFAAASLVRFPPAAVGGSTYQVVSVVNDSDVPRMFEVRGVLIRDIAERRYPNLMALDGEGTLGGRIDGVEGSTGEGDAAAAAAAAAAATAQGLNTSPPPSPTTLGRTGGGAESNAGGGGGLDVATTFTCMPQAGVLLPRQHTLLLARFSPTCDAHFEADLQLQVYAGGHSQHESLTVALHADTHVPRLELLTSRTQVAASPREEAETRITFPPTCITGETAVAATLVNVTGAPVAYQLTVSRELLGTVRVEPAAGVLTAGERKPVTLCFAPEMARHYEGSVLLLTRAAGAGAAGEYLTAWPARGEGTHALVEVQPTQWDCGEVAGLEPQHVALTVYNSGTCEVGYEVRALTCKEPGGWQRATQPPTLCNHAGTLPARTHKVVLVTVYPAAGRSEYLLYVMVAGLGTRIAEVPSPTTVAEAEQHPHCRLTIRGTRPSVQVGDVRSLSQFRSHLWRQLAIPALNRQLAARVRPQDVSAEAYAFQQFTEGLTPVTMELAVGRQHAAAAVLTVLLVNVGDCAASFSLWLPTESSVTEESWFLEDGALADIQAILDKRIIDIYPRSGSIPAGGTAVLTLVYRFLEVGVHALPVALRIADGRRALMVLEGCTVPEGVSCLTTHSASAEYELLPVALGDVEPPMQSIMTLDNPLDRPVAYRVDAQALRQLSEENYGFPILQCVNPTGILPPRSMTELHWHFRPLEAKTYHMNVPVITSFPPGQDEAGDGGAEELGESYAFTLVGRGYHPRRTSVEEVRALTAQAFLAIPPTPPGSGAAAEEVAPLPVTLSPEVLALGAVPYYALHRACCTLVNNHPTDAYRFEWDTHHGFGDHLLTVQPSRGSIPANGGRVECRISFYSGSTSRLLQWTVPCRLTNETAMERLVAAEGGTAAGSVASTTGTAPAAASEYLAADGVGLELAAADGDAGFTRRTCTKAALMRLRAQQAARAGTQRLPVTAIPAESLGVEPLPRSAQVRRGTQTTVATSGAGSGAVANSLTPGGAESVVSAVVELLVQARVMSVEEYERVYGQDGLQRAHQPLVRMFQDPVSDGPTPGAAPSSTMDGAALASEVMEELVRAVVAQPVVAAAFTEPHGGAVRYYHEVRHGGGVGHGAAAGVAPPQARGGGEVLGGLVGNVLEEALEELVFQAVTAGVAASAA